MTGKLYIVATPIGNLKDITLRALEILELVDWIACEDTRHTLKLLQHFGISKPLVSLHDHNEDIRKQELYDKLLSGQTGALVSDAGTPLISDPGFHLVSFLREKEIEVEPIPGPSALITALSAAGMPTDRFAFEGFLPAKSAKRVDVLKSLEIEARTLIFYESTHRLIACLEDMAVVFGRNRKICVAKELTKQYERFVSGTLDEVINQFGTNKEWQKGEFVLIVSGAKPVEQNVNEYDALTLLLLEKSLPVKQISEIVSEFYSVKKKEVYQRALDLKGV